MKSQSEKSDDDLSLVERAAAGERQAFDVLVRRHLGRCYRIARRFGLSPEDAADVVQESFLAAYRALPRYNFSFQFSTWITRILLNRLANFRRAVRRAKRFFWQPHANARTWAGPEASTDATPETLLQNSELAVRLSRAIQKLPETQRTVFVLFEMEGFKTREIAVMLDVPEGTVTSRLHHARLALREQLADLL